MTLLRTRQSLPHNFLQACRSDQHRKKRRLSPRQGRNKIFRRRRIRILDRVIPLPIPTPRTFMDARIATRCIGDNMRGVYVAGIR